MKITYSNRDEISADTRHRTPDTEHRQHNAKLVSPFCRSALADLQRHITDGDVDGVEHREHEHNEVLVVSELSGLEPPQHVRDVTANGAA